jgi:hypothetical protein
MEEAVRFEATQVSDLPTARDVRKVTRTGSVDRDFLNPRIVGKPEVMARSGLLELLPRCRHPGAILVSITRRK